MSLMYLLAITAAKNSIYIENSYFVPDGLMRDALLDAVRRGVKVRIIVPGPHMDAETVRRASRGGWGPLLDAGIEIHEFQPTMFHCKSMVVDELMVSVGSTNFDDRSLRLNDEANLNIFDREFARAQIEIFQQDLKRAKRITVQQWHARPLSEKFIEHTAALFAPLL
jgi:cardiolipin synthase